jgi:hypothetical protein
MVSLPPPDLLELFYDGQWNTVTGQPRASAGVTMSRGVSAEGTRAEPSSADMLLGNRDGRFSRRDPNSALYGKIGPNTPIRYSVQAGHPYLLLPGDEPSGLTTPDHASLGVTDLDLRIEVALDDYTATQELAARYVATGNQRHFNFRLVNGGQMWLEWYPDGTLASQKSAGSLPVVPANPRQRIALRVVLDVNNGSGGHLVSFYWAPTIGATVWTLLDTDTAGAGTTTLIDGTAGLQLGTNTAVIGNGTKGRIYAMELWDGATATRKVRLDFTTAKAGDTSFTDTDGLVWTLAGAASLSNQHIRMAGEVPSWPPERDRSGQDRTVPITPAGITRRLGAGNRPLESALLRFIRAASPIDCWPLTDGQQATAATSLVQGATMTPVFTTGSGPVQWAQGSLAEWVEPVAQAPASNSFTMRGTLPDSAAAASGWSAEFAIAGLLTGSAELRTFDRGAGSDADNRISWLVALDPSADEVEVRVTSAGATSSSFTVVGFYTGTGVFDSQPHHIRLTITPQPGPGTTAWALYIDGALIDSGTHAVVTKAPLYVQPGCFQSNTTGNTPSLGFVTCWGPDAPPAADVYDALLGFQGETAGARFLRLCAEQGVPAAVLGDEDDTTPLGVQQLQTFLDALASIAKADHGYALEQRDDRALLYRPRTTLYNQDPVLTLDFSQGVISPPFKPLDDDKDAENDILVTRAGGSFGRVSRETIAEGPKSVEAIGRYDVAHTLSLAEDAQAIQHAGWRLHLGTADGLRYTQITLDLGNPRVQTMARDIYLADVGDKIRLTNLPADHGPDDVDLIIRGYKETVSEREWKITFNCTPGAVYNVLQLNAGAYSRLDTGGSELAAGINTTATTLPVAVTGTALWSTSAGDVPFSVLVGGEEMTATAVASSVRDTFGRTVASGWGAADSGQTWTVVGTASDFSVSGGLGRHSLPAVSTVRHSVIPQAGADFDLMASMATSVLAAGGSHLVYAVARYVDTSNSYLARLEFTTAQAVILSIRKRVGGVETQLATFTTGLAHTAGGLFRVRFQGVGSQLRAKAWLASGTEPGLWQVSVTDTDLTAAGSLGVRSVLSGSTTGLPVVATFDNLEQLNPQSMTVTRSVNGIAKSHPAGAGVRLAKPLAIAL